MATFDLQGMFDWAVYWCNKPNVEYWMSASRRNMREIDGITYFDCSSFVFFAVWLGGGYDIGQLGYPTDLEGYKTKQGADGYNAWVVHTMTPKLPKIGFTRLNPNTEVWQPGDILSWYNSRTGNGHTEICYARPRVTMGAHGRKNRTPADMVSINNFNIQADYYQDLWRYSGETPVTPPEPPLPPDPDPGGNAGVDTGKRTPFIYYMKPYWKI